MFRIEVDVSPSYWKKGKYNSVTKFYFLGVCLYKKQIQFSKRKNNIPPPQIYPPPPINRKD